MFQEAQVLYIDRYPFPYAHKPQINYTCEVHSLQFFSHFYNEPIYSSPTSIPVPPGSFAFL